MNYASIKALAAELAVSPDDLIALSRHNDPFYAAVPRRLAMAEWFATLWRRFGWGDGMHLRRAHYVLVSQSPPILKPSGAPYENTDGDWTFLATASLAARYLHLIPHSALVDRRNPDPIVNAVNGPIAGKAPAIEVNFKELDWQFELPGDLDVEDSLYAPRFGVSGNGLAWGQPYLVELWIEKSTMNDILGPPAQRLGVNLVPGLGEASEILARQAVERAIAAQRPMRILYISDFDPAGRSMPCGLARKIEFILHDADLDVDIQLEPILLLPEQCEQYALPRTPIKETERRTGAFEKRFGAGATELDALEALHPGELARIVEAEVQRYIDPTLPGRCSAAYFDISRQLDKTTALAHEHHAAAIAALDGRYRQILVDLQCAIDEAKDASEDLADDGRDLWRRIASDMEAAPPSIQAAMIPAARPANPHAAPLFDSRRSYLEQLDAYRRWKGK